MDLMQYLESSKKSLFRFEYLQDYDIPSEQKYFKAYKDAGVLDYSLMEDWWNFLESKKNNGVILQRVRLVRKPLTKYTQWSFEIYKETVKHGDEIRILPEEKLTPDLDRLKDFWLIDDSTVLEMKYTPIGEYLGFDKIDNLTRYLEIKKYLLENSISYGDIQ